MIIAKETLKVWKSLKEEGDAAALAELIGKSEMTVYKIFRDRQCTVEDAEKINGFYQKRAKRVRAIAIRR